MGATCHPRLQNPTITLDRNYVEYQRAWEHKTPFHGVIPPITTTIASFMPSQHVIANQLLSQSDLVIHYD